MKPVIKVEVALIRGSDGQLYSGFINRLQDDDEQVYSALNLSPQFMYPGCMLTIDVPECPNCQRPATEAQGKNCSCGHDWETWGLERSRQLNVEPPHVSPSPQAGQENHDTGTGPTK